MNVFITSQIESVEKKMAGYHALLSYRYSNLCIKADPASLLSVTLIMGSMEKDIEEVAEVAKPEDEYHLAVVPKIQDFIMDINQAVLDTHPEFKVEMKPLGDGNDRNRFLLYEMPEVNKERRDFLNETVDSLYNECKVRIEAVTNEQKMTFAEFLTGKPEELKEANDALNKSNDDYMSRIQKLLNTKRQEIEEGYQRYLVNHSNDCQNDAGFDVTSSIRLSNE